MQVKGEVDMGEGRGDDSCQNEVVIIKLWGLPWVLLFRPVLEFSRTDVLSVYGDGIPGQRWSCLRNGSPSRCQQGPKSEPGPQEKKNDFTELRCLCK